MFSVSMVLRVGPTKHPSTYSKEPILFTNLYLDSGNDWPLGQAAAKTTPVNYTETNLVNNYNQQFVSLQPVIRTGFVTYYCSQFYSYIVVLI